MKKYIYKISAIIVMAGIITGISVFMNAAKINTAINGQGISFGSQPFIPNENQVCFYEHENFGGNYICLNSNGEYPDLGRFFVGTSNNNWHDKISSVIIGANACAIMYEHPNGGGYCLTLRGTGSERRIPKLSAWGFNDKASHIKSLPYPQNLPPEPGPNQVFFFEHSNYDGYYMGLSFDRDISNVGTYYFSDFNSPNWNDKISSIKVGTNACATTWFNKDYKGQRNFFEGNGMTVANSPDLGPSGIGDKITSFKIRMRTICSTQ